MKLLFENDHIYCFECMFPTGKTSIVIITKKAYNQRNKPYNADVGMYFVDDNRSSIQNGSFLEQEFTEWLSVRSRQDKSTCSITYHATCYYNDFKFCPVCGERLVNNE